jgi:hypothetical protein
MKVAVPFSRSQPAKAQVAWPQMLDKRDMVKYNKISLSP